MKHTAEPWRTPSGFDEPVVFGGADTETHPICIALDAPYRDLSTRKANAERIVSCVNACKGINPEAVPELLKALKRCVPWIGKMIADGAHQNSVAPLDCENALRQAEAAIANATKETVKARLEQLLQVKRISQSGWGGILSNGNIVDRREHPNAIPIAKNSMFGVPEPNSQPHAGREKGTA